MLNTLTNWLNSLTIQKDQYTLRFPLRALADRYSSCALSTAGLVITATSGKKVPKTGAADSYYSVNGVLRKIASGTDMPALSGTVTNATFNVFCFYVDSAGTTTSQIGTAGATLAAVVFPQPPEQKAMIGFIIINPTGTGDFVGNTTALDDVTVVPNTVYVSPIGSYDPTVLL